MFRGQLRVQWIEGRLSRGGFRPGRSEKGQRWPGHTYSYYSLRSSQEHFNFPCQTDEMFHFSKQSLLGQPLYPEQN